MNIAIIGSGIMGRGIAQVFVTYGNNVNLIDIAESNLESAKLFINKMVGRLEEKGKISDAKAILDLITYSNSIDSISDCDLVIEAVAELLSIKQDLFRQLEARVSVNTVLATNTSSISVTAIASACKNPERVLGIHFFNPAPLMPLVEVVQSLQVSSENLIKIKDCILLLNKEAVITKDTPGFIVNRIARPFYSEAIKMYEEGVADMRTIDYAMTKYGNFRMGPFELMDYIGNDVNYTVTETVFKSFYYDPRYKPSITQLRYKEAGWYGRKSGRGFYDYNTQDEPSKPKKDDDLCCYILERILVMLFNEAIDALFLKIATYQDIEIAMTKGVNYPKGLLDWAQDFGHKNIYERLLNLHSTFGDDRYRPSVLLKELAEKE